MTVTICDGYKSKEEDDIHNVTLFYICLMDTIYFCF